MCYLVVLLVVVQSVDRVRNTGLALPIAQLVLDAVRGRNVEVDIGGGAGIDTTAVGGEARVFAAVLLGIVGLAQGMAAATAYAASARLIYALARDGQQQQQLGWRAPDHIRTSELSTDTIPVGIPTPEGHPGTEGIRRRDSTQDRTRPIQVRAIAWMRKWCLKKNKGQAPYVGVWLSVAVGCVIECAYIGSAVAVSFEYFFFPFSRYHSLPSNM